MFLVCMSATNRLLPWRAYFFQALRNGISSGHSDALIRSLNDRLDKFYDATHQIKDAKQGDNSDIDCAPETGTQIFQNGKPVVSLITREDFYRA
jgi:hypothetical protein